MNDSLKTSGSSFAASWGYTFLFVCCAVACMPFIDLNATWIGVFAISGNVALASVCAIWCSLIRGWFVYVVGVVMLLFCGATLAFFSTPKFDVSLMLLPFAIATPIATTLELVKRKFGQFEKATDSVLEINQWWRFGTKHLLILMTVIGMLLGIGNVFSMFMPAVPDSVSSFDILATLFAVAGAISFNTLTKVWALMGKAVFRRALVSVAVASATFVFVCWKLSHVDPWVWLAVIGGSYLTSYCLLLLLRLEGWRFVGLRDQLMSAAINTTTCS